MKDRYTIGEVAELLNISPQSLRFYDKAGVVVPVYTNPKTGYRYYSYDQIHYIDRVSTFSALASHWRISGTLWTPTT